MGVHQLLCELQQNISHPASSLCSRANRAHADRRSQTERQAEKNPQAFRMCSADRRSPSPSDLHRSSKPHLLVGGGVGGEHGVDGAQQGGGLEVGVETLQVDAVVRARDAGALQALPALTYSACGVKPGGGDPSCLPSAPTEYDVPIQRKVVTLARQTGCREKREDADTQDIKPRRPSAYAYRRDLNWYANTTDIGRTRQARFQKPMLELRDSYTSTAILDTRARPLMFAGEAA